MRGIVFEREIAPTAPGAGRGLAPIYDRGGYPGESGRFATVLGHSR